MKNKILSLLSFLIILIASVSLIHFLNVRERESMLSLAYIGNQVNEVEHVISILRYGEEHSDRNAFEKIDCNVYVTFNEKIRTFRYQIESNYLFLDADDKATATNLINQASERLAKYKNRNGEKDCNLSDAILKVL